MTKKRFRSISLVILPLSLIATFAVAQDGFFDDFSDGDVTDNSPVTWSPLGSSTLTVEDGDLVVSGNVGLFGLSFSGARVLDRQFGDVSHPGGAKQRGLDRPDGSRRHEPDHESVCR